MYRMLRITSFLTALFIWSLNLFAQPVLLSGATNSKAMLAEYFRNEAAVLAASCLSDIQSRSDFEARRPEFRRELQEMLGLWPVPERTDLKSMVAGRVEQEGFTVEKVSFQASPGLYCTANLFIPKNLTNPAPTILYESGHWRLFTNGISYGNKAAYQVDGAWFARNGYVCLVMDTVLAGEIQGIHTGTRDKGLWWWNSRGYTPAGVEAWFGIRALDYLCTRPEVDTNRLGITGHSGGGAYSWTVTALDDRIAAAAPLAGMTDVKHHIVDNLMDRHCDCNFPVNIYRWDFPQLAALAAPRPLLIGGTDSDDLFPLDSTVAIHEKLRQVYKLYGTNAHLALTVAHGPHDEVPELRLAVLRWFDRHLKGITKDNEPPIVVDAVKYLTPEQVRVFTNQLPADNINSNIADTFVAKADLEKQKPETAEKLRAVLHAKVFAGWPSDDLPLEVKPAFEIRRDELLLRAWDFASQHDVSLRLYLLENAAAKNTGGVTLQVLDRNNAGEWLAAVRALAGGKAEVSESLAGEFAGTNLPAIDSARLEQLKAKAVSNQTALAFFAPRGVGLTDWQADEKAMTKIRRRFMLLGQTLDGMRVWDIRSAIQTLHFVRDGDPARVELKADGFMAVNALYAALFEPAVKRIDFTNLPASHSVGPDYLGVLKYTDIPQVQQAVLARTGQN